MRTMADIIDVTGLQREVERRAESMGLRCQFIPNIPTAYITQNTIVMPMLPVPFDMDRFRVIRMMYIHELGHWYNKRAMSLRQEYPVDVHCNMGAVWNILEDELDERSQARKFPGDAKALGEGHAIFMQDQVVDMLAILRRVPSLPPDDIKKLACYVLAASTRDWDGFMPPILMMMRRKFPPEVAELVDELTSEGWADKIKGMRDADDVFSLAKKLVKRLWPESDPDKECEDAKKNKGKPQPTPGEGEPADGSTPTKKSDDPKSEVVSVIPWDKLVLAEHDADMQQGKPSRIDWTGKHSRGGTFVPASPNQFKIIEID